MDSLIEGYRRFRSNSFAKNVELYRELGESGQSPRVMVIACCDSRVDPATIFDAGPGDIFVVRNVANLVPPHRPNDDYHGTSSALEFAVAGLEVQHILVLGHTRCGGIAACLAPKAQGRFIGKWMSILDDTVASVRRETASHDADAQHRALERAGVAHSLENLMTFPFVSERVRQGRLALHGGLYDVTSGLLEMRDPLRGDFLPVDDVA